MNVLSEAGWKKVDEDAAGMMPSRIRCDYPHADGRLCILDCGHPSQSVEHRYERAIVQRGQIWQHTKTGVFYKIVEVGIFASAISSLPEGTIIVAYRALKSRREEPRTWFRELDNFLDTVPDNEKGGWMPRFQRRSARGEVRGMV